MRVEIVPDLAAGARSEAGETSAAAAAENTALKGFLAAVNSSDSFFRVQQCAYAFPAAALQEGSRSFRRTFLIGFSEEDFNHNRGLFFTLLEKMTELLREEGSADSLEVRLSLTSTPGDLPGRASHALMLELCARGSTPEQAELRWSLGLVHVQQALFFTSRQLRQQTSSRGD
jgi:hypothetical protein